MKHEIHLYYALVFMESWQGDKGTRRETVYSCMKWEAIKDQHIHYFHCLTMGEDLDHWDLITVQIASWMKQSHSPSLSQSIFQVLCIARRLSNGI